MADASEAHARALIEAEYRERITVNFRAFVEEVEPSFIWYRHCEALGDALDRVARGELKRLMVFEPPRHGKSEEVSRLFTPYYVYKFPTRTVGLASYAADLAHGLSRAAMERYTRVAPVNQDVSAAREWRTLEGGGMWAAGVGGPITGKGFHLGVIDDPLKNAEEAESEIVRAAHREWYRSTWSTRREPNAAEVIIQTRWHVDDLSGWLLSSDEEMRQGWHIICLPAVAEAAHVFPVTCSVEPDWRATGEALCPERYDLDALDRQRGISGSRHWAALYQQRPTIEEGNIWKREWFRSFTTDTDGVDDGCDWDLAYTKDDANSGSAFIRSCRDALGNIFVTDLGVRYLEFPELVEWMHSQKAAHYVEAKASGKSAVQSLKRQGIYAQEVEVQGGDKIARTRLATPPVEAGKVFIKAHLLDFLLDDPKQGILKAGNGFESDLNDVFVQAINRHWTPGTFTEGQSKDMGTGRSEVKAVTHGY
jgi:hypothetical protein